MSRRSKSTTRRPARRPRRAVMPEFGPEKPSFGRRALNAGQTLAKLVAIGIPTVTAVQLLRLYPKEVRDALYSISDFPGSAYDTVTGIPDAVRGIPASILRLPGAAYDAVAGIPGYGRSALDFMLREGEQPRVARGFGGARRRGVRKTASRTTLRPVSRARTPARRRRSGRGEGGAARPLTAYQKFVKRHRRPGVSMSQVAKMWRNR